MKVTANKIEFDNGEHLTFDYPILKTVIHEGVIIILLNVPPKVIFNENVFGLTQSGDFLWQIGKTEKENDNCPFIDMNINDDGRLIIRNWCHINCEIDSKTGQILKTEGYAW